MADQTRNLAILLFHDAEVLDFCGPFEVFSVANHQTDFEPFNVFLVAEPRPVQACNGLSVNPDYGLEDCPPIDILLVPGGIGTRTELQRDPIIGWIKQRASDAQLILSVCTGSLLLAKADLLDGLEATTHHSAIDLLKQMAPRATIRDDLRFVDNGKTITSAGIAAGIDMSLHVVQRLLGPDVAVATARQMEYPWPTPSS